jgi:hypothetical protein
MSADPFANTTTVKNILNHIISPKIVKDGSGGYTTKTDLVNIDNLLFASSSNVTGSVLIPLTSQVGVVTIERLRDSITVYHSRVTANSIILATNKTVETSNRRTVSHVTPVRGSFTIYLDGENGANGVSYISWFIASF